MPDPELDAITLRGMSFHTRIGVLPHEREHAQPVEIDLTAWVSGQGILDYRRVYSEVREALEAPSLFYLEELAESIAERVLRERAVHRVRIAVRKPHAALGGPLESVEVAIVRERDA
ncbi:MAG TPA: dihydroneopterin aldolase [Gemmatimonadaceae bacterium]|nr:dihydroneopterin aldolase [Gemmatimonadaceae bacterium]